MRPVLFSLIVWGGALLYPLVREARAEVFVLERGGRVEGELLNPKQKPRTDYVIKTKAGKLTLAADQVKEVLKPRPEELEYLRIRGDYPDTVAGQLELADWCRDHKLTQSRKRHLERVVELDPDHVEARRLLGFQKRDGAWKTQAQIMTERGYVKDPGGRWVLPQEIELRERERKNELSQKEWFKKLKMWREWLDTDKAAQAAELISDIQDPYALSALTRALADEPREDRRKLLLRALARIDTPAARRAIADQSLNDPNEDVRLTCLEHLAKTPDPSLVQHFVANLKSKFNPTVNRAAMGLAQMQDVSAIGPLIDALITTHKFKVQIGSPGYSAGMTNGQVNGFSAGGGPKIVSQRFQNLDVLNALVSLAGGQNFEYDVTRWRYWHAAQKKAKQMNGRRDVE